LYYRCAHSGYSYLSTRKYERSRPALSLTTKTHNHVFVFPTDTGLAKKHPDLPRSSRGTDRTQSSGTVLNWRRDVKGHGTHVSGTVAAVGGNSLGVVGVADGARLFVTRALDDGGNAQESDVYEAVKQCAAAGAHIISMSLGGSRISDAFKALMDDLYYNKNILIFAVRLNSLLSPYVLLLMHSELIFFSITGSRQ
jgi:Subtilase family